MLNITVIDEIDLLDLNEIERDRIMLEVEADLAELEAMEEAEENSI